MAEPKTKISKKVPTDTLDTPDTPKKAKPIYKDQEIKVVAKANIDRSRTFIIRFKKGKMEPNPFLAQVE